MTHKEALSHRTMAQHTQDCGLKSMTIQPDYVKKASASFAAPFGAVRELCDGSKAPEKEFNRWEQHRFTIVLEDEFNNVVASAQCMHSLGSLSVS